MDKSRNEERLSGVVERITYHNEENGWSVLKVSLEGDSGRMSTVVVHQAKVFAGATMDFWGTWKRHPKHGEQFGATRALEKQPATSAALEKYLGSGLIKGVGPATAKIITSHFKERTLEVFESSIDELLTIPGIAKKKLKVIKSSWDDHRTIRDVMIFLQGYGISTLFATKIFKVYGNRAISLVEENPYRLVEDVSGIGFFSADKIALSMGVERAGVQRLEAGIRHVLSMSRSNGHCYLTEDQVFSGVSDLLREKLEPELVKECLVRLLINKQIRTRNFNIVKDSSEHEMEKCFYSTALYDDEESVAGRVRQFLGTGIDRDLAELKSWVDNYCHQNKINLSDEQYRAVVEIPKEAISVLTGGPGCGKTTCTKVLVQLLRAKGVQVTLAAPTGRAAQRMTEVIGVEAKTIHRLLEWNPALYEFNHGKENPLVTDFLILDETSMLDISLAARLLEALPDSAQVLFIGDPDQLPSVGAGRVLADLLGSESTPRYCLTQVFRQAAESYIIRFAHEINSGKIPEIGSPVKDPKAFEGGVDCLFVDCDEATRSQINFIQRVQGAVKLIPAHGAESSINFKNKWLGQEEGGESQPEAIASGSSPLNPSRFSNIEIPDEFQHVNLAALFEAGTEVEQLGHVLKEVHPWSTLKYGMTAVETLVRLYMKSIPEWMGSNPEIQVLSPQIRGSLGTQNLNRVLQASKNPESEEKPQIVAGEKTFRLNDRVIQTKNNYELGIFNGDIGKIVSVSTKNSSIEVQFSGLDKRKVEISKEGLMELQLAYAITIHKSQGSEFEVVIIPVLGQHFKMLYRNLIYTGLTRAKRLAIFVGNRKAFNMAIRQIDNRKRQTGLTELIDLD